jgi:hypothetical protein
LSDQALAEATKARTAVNNTKMDLQNQLTATGDSSVAASNALAAAKVNQEARPFQPLGNMFGNVMGGLNNAASAATGDTGLIGAPPLRLNGHPAGVGVQGRVADGELGPALAMQPPPRPWC